MFIITAACCFSTAKATKTYQWIQTHKNLRERERERERDCHNKKILSFFNTSCSTKLPFALEINEINQTWLCSLDAIVSDAQQMK